MKDRMLCRKRGLLGLLAIASTASAFPAQPFDLRSHGATGDGQSSDTAALQSAIGACAEAGGGQVHLPPCRYLSGTIHLRGGVTLHLEKGTRLGEFADKKCHAFEPPAGGDWLLVLESVGRKPLEASIKLHKP